MKIFIFILLFFTSTILFAQTEQRIKIVSVTPSVNTGQDYSSWLSDDLNNLVPNEWSAANLSWVDVTLKLEKQSTLTRLSFYDYEGVFTDKPATIYALKGTEKTYLGVFTGESYKSFVNLKLSNPTIADAIIIHKYSNNVPEKIQVYGTVNQVQTAPIAKTQSVISFANLTNKIVGDAAFNLTATSNNTVTPVTFTSSNPTVVSVSNASGSWKATPLTAGTALITASQLGNANYLAAENIVKTQVINKGQSVINFADLTNKTFGDAAYALTATSNNSVAPITFTSSNSTVVSVSDASGSWKATPLSAGTTVITASQIGNNNYFSAINVTKTQVVNKIKPIINFEDLTNKSIGDAAYALTATSNNTVTPVTFTSSNPAVVSVSNTSGSWKATPLTAGTTLITASQAESTNYLAAANVVKTQVVSQQAQLQISNQNKLPMIGKYWYQLNNTGDQITATTGLQQLVDGNITDPVFNGWGKIFSNYDCFYEFKNLTNVIITKIRFYDGDGSFTDNPFKLYAKATLTSDPVLIATFTGESANKWIEITLPSPVKAQYLVANVWWGFPVEMELYGSAQNAPAVNLFPKKEIKFAAMDGVNSFVWDFLESWDNINIRDKIFEPKKNLLNTFSQYRDYVDWGKIEPTQGNFTFNPTQDGGWNYDVMYKRLKDEGKDVVACLKTLPGWFLTKYYPTDQQDSEDIPAPSGSNLLDPNSYILQAKLAFQFAARYGNNKNISTNLQNGVVTGVVYPSAPEAGTRTRETGLGYLKYIECENERDKWWKGRKAYQTAKEYAANLSAFYDGHKNTMGAGVGVKNADPDMQVVIGGIAGPSVDYIKGIIDWCKEFRGYKADGSVNLCFDVINYHYYSNSSGTSQDGSSSSGAAPELSGSAATAIAFSELAREYNVEVWITEAGYDVNPHSPLRAPAIGSKTAEEVQADWILRSALLYAQAGINRLFFYQTYDENIDSWGQFASSGLLNGTTRKRKPAADFLLQTKKLIGNYSYKETIQDNPTIHRYQLQDTSVYVAYVPLAQGKTIDYNLNLGSASKAKIYTLKIGKDSMDIKEVNLTNNSLNVTLSETPVFIRVLNPNLVNANSSLVKSLSVSYAGSGLDKMMATKSVNSLSDSVTDINTTSFASLTLYPNPMVDFVTVSFNNSIMGSVKLRVFNAANGITYKQIVTNKSDVYFTQKIDMNTLTVGTYILEIQQDGLKTSRKIIKSH
ncbi:MAG: T9SS type A sorting domain-containing protein [Janthinobacterium lividum]